jgi:hypothetical protein
MMNDRFSNKSLSKANLPVTQMTRLDLTFNISILEGKPRLSRKEKVLMMQLMMEQIRRKKVHAHL